MNPRPGGKRDTGKLTVSVRRDTASPGHSTARPGHSTARPDTRRLGPRAIVMPLGAQRGKAATWAARVVRDRHAPTRTQCATMIGAEAHVGRSTSSSSSRWTAQHLQGMLEEHGEGVRGRRCLHISAVPCASLLLEQLKGLVCNHGLDQANDQGPGATFPQPVLFSRQRLSAREG